MTEDAEKARYKLALERIVGLQHDAACSGSAPLYECGCYEASPSDLARAALDGVDWEPSSRKARALALYDVMDMNESDPYAQLTATFRRALERADESEFEKTPLYSWEIGRVATRHMTEAERADVERLSRYEHCEIFARLLADEVMR